MISLAKWSRLLALGLMALVLFNATARAHENEEGGRVPMPNEVEGKGDKCVQPEDEMRRNHMKYILHQRDETMHQGIRTKQYSLNECINCHVEQKADGSYPSIHTSEHFCNSCHTYAAVHIDCFQCHATHPNDKGADAHATPRASSTNDSSLRTMAKARAAGEMAQ